jgi:hypothetical protein
MLLKLASDRELEGQADPSGPEYTLGDQEVPEGLKLVESDVGKCHAVEDASTREKRILGPHHRCLGLNEAAVRPQADMEGCVRREPHGELYAGTPFAQVTGPTHPGSRTRDRLWCDQERELNWITAGLASLRSVAHGPPFSPNI